MHISDYGKLEGRTLTLSSGLTTTKDLKIDETTTYFRQNKIEILKSNYITEVTKGAFINISNLKEVHFPKIKKIGARAFEDCINLKKFIGLQNKGIEIHESAFLKTPFYTHKTLDDLSFKENSIYFNIVEKMILQKIMKTSIFDTTFTFNSIKDMDLDDYVIFTQNCERNFPNGKISMEKLSNFEYAFKKNSMNFTNDKFTKILLESSLKHLKEMIENGRELIFKHKRKYFLDDDEIIKKVKKELEECISAEDVDELMRVYGINGPFQNALEWNDFLRGISDDPRGYIKFYLKPKQRGYISTSTYAAILTICAKVRQEIIEKHNVSADTQTVFRKITEQGLLPLLETAKPELHSIKKLKKSPVSYHELREMQQTNPELSRRSFDFKEQDPDGKIRKEIAREINSKKPIIIEKAFMSTSKSPILTGSAALSYGDFQFIIKLVPGKFKGLDYDEYSNSWTGKEEILLAPAQKFKILKINDTLNEIEMETV